MVGKLTLTVKDRPTVNSGLNGLNVEYIDHEAIKVIPLIRVCSKRALLENPLPLLPMFNFKLVVFVLASPNRIDHLFFFFSINLVDSFLDYNGDLLVQA